MKTKTLVLTISIALLLGIFSTADARGYRNQAYYDFYHTLAPHGDWFEVDGMVVWQPAFVSRHWAPYKKGNWIWTDYGWYWDSYEPFGSVVYHYGRWFYDDYYGWLWMPDNQWAPAWVEWRYDDAFIGWAPLSPYAEFSVTFGLRFSRHYQPPVHCWNYVKVVHFPYNRLDRYYIDAAYVPGIHGRTKARTNYYAHNNRVFNQGPDRHAIERRANTTLKTRNVEFRRSNDSRIRSNQTSRSRVTVYEPGDNRNSKSRRNDVNIRSKKRSLSLNKNDVRIGRTNDTDSRSGRQNNRGSDIRKGRDDYDGTINKRQRTFSSDGRFEAQRSRSEPASSNRSINRDEVSGDRGSTIERSNKSRYEKKDKTEKNVAPRKRNERKNDAASYEKKETKRERKAPTVRSKSSNSRESSARKSRSATRPDSDSRSSSDNGRSRR